MQHVGCRVVGGKLTEGYLLKRQRIEARSEKHDRRVARQAALCSLVDLHLGGWRNVFFFQIKCDNDAKALTELDETKGNSAEIE